MSEQFKNTIWQKLPFILVFTIIVFSVSFIRVNKGISDERLDNIGFKLGNEVLIGEHLDLLVDKRVGLITNSTGILSDGKPLYEVLLERGIKVIRIFTPEHGFEANDDYSLKLPVPVTPLYKQNNHLTSSDLDNIDVLIYDIQDLGVRYYTYISTLYYTMRDACENYKEYIVCDRPSIASLSYIDGFMLDSNYESFVGAVPVPIMYGMTSGELAQLLKSQISGNSNFNLKVIAMKGYTRLTNFETLNLPWVKPSPSIPDLMSARLYPALCFLEGVNISVGRGTNIPFQVFGAPGLNTENVISELEKANIKGVSFSLCLFTPDKKISSYNPEYMYKECKGIALKVTDFQNYEPVKINILILIALKKHFAGFRWTKNNFIDKLAGTNRLRRMIDNGSSFEEIVDSYQEDIKNFNELRTKYLLYN
ncbi:MAG: exo-beta-N-acetylmuramidase NamZ family protein [Ignavibacteria bacterium]